MGKTKTKGGGDFKKRKQKLGKKKLAPTNATSTAIKVRSIALPEQALTKTEPTTHRNLTMGELLSQLKHYSGDVRHDALQGMHELLSRLPSPPNAAEMLDGVLPLFVDVSANVRKAALGVLRLVLPPIAQAGAISPHEPLLRLHLQSALAHPKPSIRADALPLLQLLLQVMPEGMCPPPPQLLPSLADMLGSGSVGVHGAGRVSPLEAKMAAIEAVRALLAAQATAPARARAAAPAEGGSEPSSEPRVTWPAQRMGFAAWRCPVAGGGGGTGGGTAGAIDGGAPLSQLLLLPPLLVQVWLECGAYLASGCSPAAVQCALSAVQLARELLLLDEARGARGARGAAAALDDGDGDDDEAAAAVALPAVLWRGEPRGSGVGGGGAVAGGPLAQALLPAMMRHVGAHVPLQEGQAADSGMRRRQLNAVLCETMALLLRAHGPAAAADAPAVELRQRLARFVSDALAPRSERWAGGVGGGGGVASLLRAAALLLADGCGRADLLAGLQEALVARWEQAPLDEPTRPQLLDLLAARVLPAALLPGAGAAAAAAEAVVWPPPRVNDGGAHGTAAAARVAVTGALLPLAQAVRWLQSLPKLLWQLGDAQPALTAAILKVLIALARGGGALLAADEPTTAAPPDAPSWAEPGGALARLQPALEPFFCARLRGPTQGPLLGPYVTLPEEVRRLAAQLLHYLPELLERMLQALLRCALHEPHHAVPLLHAVEHAAGRGAVSPNDYVSFVLTIALEVAAPPTTAGDGHELWEKIVHQLRQVAHQHGEAALGPVRDVCTQAAAEGAACSRRARAAHALLGELAVGHA